MTSLHPKIKHVLVVFHPCPSCASCPVLGTSAVETSAIIPAETEICETGRCRSSLPAFSANALHALDAGLAALSSSRRYSNQVKTSITAQLTKGSVQPAHIPAQLRLTGVRGHSNRNRKSQTVCSVHVASAFSVGESSLIQVILPRHLC